MPTIVIAWVRPPGRRCSRIERLRLGVAQEAEPEALADLEVMSFGDDGVDDQLVRPTLLGRPTLHDLHSVLVEETAPVASETFDVEVVEIGQAFGRERPTVEAHVARRLNNAGQVVHLLQHLTLLAEAAARGVDDQVRCLRGRSRYWGRPRSSVGHQRSRRATHRRPTTGARPTRDRRAHRRRKSPRMANHEPAQTPSFTGYRCRPAAAQRGRRPTPPDRPSCARSAGRRRPPAGRG